MKICYLGIGESIHMVRWAESFAGRGHDVTLLTADPGKNPAGVKTIVIADKNSFLPVKYFTGTLQIRRYLKRIKPDILHAHFLTGYGWWGWLSGFEPMIITLWGKDVYVHPGREPLSRLLGMAALRKAVLLTADSRDLLEKALRLRNRPVKAEVIQWGVDTDEFIPQKGRSELRRTLGIGESVNLIVTNRNFTERFYNNCKIMNSIPEVVSELPDTQYLFLGDGPLRREAEKLADDLKLGGYVQFTGSVPPGRMSEYLGAADLFITASDVDGTPMSLLEAMAAGLPVIAKRLPSIEEWISDDDGGILVDGYNLEKELAEATIRIVKNRGLSDSFGKRNRRVVKQRAERAGEMDRMESLYMEAVKGRYSC